MITNCDLDAAAAAVVAAGLYSRPVFDLFLGHPEAQDPSKAPDTHAVRGFSISKLGIFSSSLI
jgi:hypothetical protein